MLAGSQTFHPSLQRYLPDQLPKLQKRNCVGKTNQQAYKNAHMVEVQNKVTQHLTLPNKLVQTLLPSRTVTRATSLCNEYNQCLTDDTQQCFLNGSILSIGKSNNGNQNKESTKSGNENVATRTLFVSNTTGKGHGYNGETFFTGSRHVGGAGQLEYNDPAVLHSRGRAVSRWNTRHHFAPDNWTSPSLQPLSVINSQADNTNGSSEKKLFLEAKERTQIGVTAEEDLHLKDEINQTTKRENTHNISKNKANLAAWITNYVPPTTIEVPPPKTRFERTDYHSTFNLTQPNEESPMYINEKDRFCLTKGTPFETSSKQTLHKKRRQQFLLTKT